MPGTEPPHPPDAPSPKLDTLAAATTEMMWAVALATTRTAVASTARSLELWSQMLRTSVGRAPWSMFARPVIREPEAGPEATSDQPAPELSAEGTPPEEPPAFASYRSSSGHAAAQVIKPL